MSKVISVSFFCLPKQFYNGMLILSTFYRWEHNLGNNKKKGVMIKRH